MNRNTLTFCMVKSVLNMKDKQVNLAPRDGTCLLYNDYKKGVVDVLAQTFPISLRGLRLMRRMF